MTSVSTLDDATTPTLDDVAAIFAQLGAAERRNLADFATLLRDEQNGERQ